MMNARILLAAGVSLATLVPAVAHAQVEDIVVTARKEKETLQEVPISVAAFDQDMIARYDISDLEDIAKRTPNFTFSNNLGMFGGVPVIRGIGAPRTGSNASVGLFIDGVDTGNAGGISLQSFDVERIEVVRGPQSTQFGRGVLAARSTTSRAAPTSTRSRPNSAARSRNTACTAWKAASAARSRMAWRSRSPRSAAASTVSITTPTPATTWAIRTAPPWSAASARSSVPRSRPNSTSASPTATNTSASPPGIRWRPTPRPARSPASAGTSAR
ncbi:TonB-dependent receptor plug domain-containing protein [Novosphingobium resinovorum]